MRTKTISDLMTSVRVRAGNMGVQYPAAQDALLDYFDAAYAEVHDDLSVAYEGYYDTEYEFTTTSSDEDWPLPDDFQALVAVDYKLGSSNYQRVERYDMGERNVYTYRTQITPTGYQRYMYRLQGNNIRFQPTPTSSETFKITYVPYPTQITGSAQTLEFKQPAEEELVKLLVCKKIAMSEERSHTEIDREIDRQYQRLDKVARARDQHMPKKIQNTRKPGR